MGSLDFFMFIRDALGMWGIVFDPFSGRITSLGEDGSLIDMVNFYEVKFDASGFRLPDYDLLAGPVN